MSRTVAIGKQDFSDVITKNYFYVDKTDFIKEWWENGDDVTLVTRPRRFGKTLTMSMLNYFFSINHAGRSDLFKNLNIWKHEEYRELQGTYPVVLLSFAGVKGESLAELKWGIRMEISRTFSELEFIAESNSLTLKNKEFFRAVADGEMSDEVTIYSLNELSYYLYKYYNKKVIILLDEYDTPMQEAYVNGCWDELTGFMRRLFNYTFKKNRYQERGLLTGITRVSKESMFSDLNHIEVVTTTSKKYTTVFGFTEQEVAQALEEFNLPNEKQEIKRWYDGFKFGDRDSIYNPWSIINFLDKGEFAAYWANTSSNALAGQLIRRGSDDVKGAMEDLLQGKTFTTLLDEEIVFKQLDNEESAIWSLLIASGYLKVLRKQRNRSDETEYTVSLVNHESFLVFKHMFMEWFPKSVGYNAFEDALLKGDLILMQRNMSNIFLNTFSYFDTGSQSTVSSEPERFYHGFVLGLVVNLQDDYYVTSNRESGYGRYDVLLEPKKEGFDGIILEFKVIESGKEKTLENTVHAALQQILEKEYASELESAGIDKSKIRIYGFAFRGKEVLIDGGPLTEYESLVSPAESASRNISNLSAF